MGTRSIILVCLRNVASVDQNNVYLNSIRAFLCELLYFATQNTPFEVFVAVYYLFSNTMHNIKTLKYKKLILLVISDSIH